MQGQKALGFHQKYLNLCSEDERMSYVFATTWGWERQEFSLLGELSLLDILYINIVIFSKAASQNVYFENCYTANQIQGRTAE